MYSSLKMRDQSEIFNIDITWIILSLKIREELFALLEICKTIFLSVFRNVPILR